MTRLHLCAAASAFIGTWMHGVTAWVAPPPSLSSVGTNLRRPIFLEATGKGKKAQQRKIDDFVDFMEEPMGNLVDPSDVPAGPPHADPTAPFVKCIVAAADARKAEDIVALRVSKVSALTEFIVILTGNSRPQNQAIAANVMDDVAEQYDGMRTRGSGVPEGTADSGWILLDYGEVMVHIMTPKSRLFYDIEGQWREKGGEYMDLSDVLIPNAVVDEMGEAQIGGGMANVNEEDDPFWS